MGGEGGFDRMSGEQERRVVVERWPLERCNKGWAWSSRELFRAAP